MYLYIKNNNFYSIILFQLVAKITVLTFIQFILIY